LDVAEVHPGPKREFIKGEPMASITKRPDSRWRARYRDAAGREHAKHFNRKVDAQRWLDGVTSAMTTGTYVDPAAGRLTVGEWSTKWMAARVHLTPKTLASYDSLLRSRVLPRWSTYQLAGVRHADVASWLADMRREGLSASRTRQAYHLLKSILDAAVKDGRLARNPAAGVELPRLKRTERRYLTHQQVSALGAACGAYAPLVLTLAYTGLRWGEATALRTRNVDAMRGRLHIVEAVSDVGGRMIIGSPKSHQSRVVPVPRFLRDLLIQQISGLAPDDLVFRSPQGAMLRVANFRRRVFDRAAASVGLEGLVPHELRHTAASLAIAAGATVKGVQEMLGHASATLTLDRYGHLLADELDAVAGRLDAAAAEARADSVRTNQPAGVLRMLSASPQ